MDCPKCRFRNPPEALRCQKCDTPLGFDVGATQGGVESEPVSPAGAGAWGGGSQAALQPGSVLAGRYEIVQMLGEGGMGVVYKAKDRELDRLVALKIIHPDLARRPEAMQRFKQELILARQITHKNVIRIFDLGEGDGAKFITMEYIEGQDLGSLLREQGYLAPPEALGIIQQVCRALYAAHAQGVVHRDLKPQNIMVDKTGNVSVMDFGIARSMESTGLTRTGALIGTPEYMSPEQAKGEEVDARSDLFAMGLILYELLTGRTPYTAATPLATLLKRTQERAVPPVKLNPAIPASLSDVVVKCLEIDPKSRYQSAQEILQDLEARQGTRTGTAIPAPVARPRLAALSWKWIAAGAAALLLFGLAGFLLRGRIFRGAPSKQEPVRVLMADFANNTGEQVFTGTLEPVLTLALEGATFINSYNRGEARKLGAQLQPGSTGLDESLARLVAVREGINVVVAGSIARQGQGYRVSLKALDAVNAKPIGSWENDASKKDDVLAVVGRLAARVRKALGDATPESVQLAAAETFTAASVEAAHNYAQAQELQLAGKWDEAIAQYSQAVQLDPNLGRAYAGLAAVHTNLGHREEAEKYYRMAMSRIDRMADREKYRTRGGYYLAMGNHEKAIEEFSELVKQFPADSAGRTNLALAYFYTRNMARALEEGRRAIEIQPKSVLYRNNVALYAMYAGDFETAAKEARGVLELNPAYVKAFVALALSDLAQGRPAQAAETYHRLEKVSARGASFAAIGLADLALYEGRLAEATAILEKGVAGDLANNNAGPAAIKLLALAQAQLVRGQSGPALAAADRAVAASKQESVLFSAARIYLQVKQEAKARALASELGARLQPEPQVYAKLLEGELQFGRGELQAAVKLFQEAQKAADTWVGRFDLGRAYVQAEAYTEAHSELEHCLKRRGEAAAIFLDDVPSYRFLPPVYYYLGQAQDGLQSSGGADSYRTFLGIKAKDEGDPMVADARRRLAGR